MSTPTNFFKTWGNGVVFFVGTLQDAPQRQLGCCSGQFELNSESLLDVLHRKIRNFCGRKIINFKCLYFCPSQPDGRQLQSLKIQAQTSNNSRDRQQDKF
jgi:hypothetical protein